MKHVAVGSQNKVKIESARLAFTQVFPDEEFSFTGIGVPSGVADQPLSDAETYQGAANRVAALRKEMPDADFWVSFEGGLQEKEGEMEAFAWVMIESPEGRFGKARTSTYFLPQRVAELIREGKELGHADDIVFGRTNSKEQNGSVGILTGDRITRTAYYVEAAILALIPFRNPDLYEPVAR